MINFLEFTNLGNSFETVAAIVFYFAVYSLFGWLLENSYNYATKRKFFKANFYYGPFKPMYGFAPVLLVLFIHPESHWALVLALCFVIPTIIEYVSGALLQKFFQQQWWDYSNMPLQLHGHICLPFSLCWIVLSVVCLKWIQPAVAGFFFAIEPFWSWIWPAVVLYFIAETALAFRRYTTGALIKSPNSIQ